MRDTGDLARPFGSVIGGPYLWNIAAACGAIGHNDVLINLNKKEDYERISMAEDESPKF
jgi:hypothetical protein